jgi:hypothetical protein
MTHLAIQEAPDGVNVEWMDRVSDEELNCYNFYID